MPEIDHLEKKVIPLSYQEEADPIPLRSPIYRLVRPQFEDWTKYKDSYGVIAALVKAGRRIAFYSNLQRVSIVDDKRIIISFKHDNSLNTATYSFDPKKTIILLKLGVKI